MIDDQCIFCKLANGQIPSKEIYEDDMFKVILDLGPATKGHALIIPKEHCRGLIDLPDETTEKVMILAKRLVASMTDTLRCDGFNLVQNNEEAGGQTVFHFHLHLIPRYKDDGQKIGWKPLRPTTEQLEEIRNQIITCI